jgi:hypothetical protein
LIALDPPAPPAEEARSINVGMSPGDAAMPAPYFYVTPWPRPECGPPPPPAAGHWHTGGWFGAVLEADRITAAGGDVARRDGVREFVGAAVSACRALLARKEDGS